MTIHVLPIYEFESDHAGVSLSLQLLVTALLAQEPPEQPNQPRKPGQNIASLSGSGEVLVLYSLRSDLPIRGHEMNQSLLHGQRLQHWNIPETNVPAQAIVLHRTPTFWDRYRWRAVAVLGLLVLQFALIAALLLQRAQRQRAERALILSKDDACSSQSTISCVFSVN